MISPKARKAIADDIASQSEWLELKPNIAGLGINLNAIIRDSINAFQRCRSPITDSHLPKSDCVALDKLAIFLSSNIQKVFNYILQEY